MRKFVMRKPGKACTKKFFRENHRGFEFQHFFKKENLRGEFRVFFFFLIFLSISFGMIFNGRFW